MSRISVKRTINAPTELVFKTVADINQFSRAIPHIVKVVFLSDMQSGIGARFRETRLMNGKEVTTELEVTEYVENERIRLLADSHGCVWDTLFTVRPHNGQTELTMTMEARPYKLMARVMNLILGGMIKKAVEKDMDAVKGFCEK